MTIQKDTTLKEVLIDDTSLRALQQELEDGECTLVWDGNTPKRHVKVAFVTIHHPTSPLILVETHQLVKETGEIRRRGLRGVSEKFKPNETPAEAAKRGIKEELGIDIEHLIKAGYRTETKYSGSYPQLLSEYQIWEFETILRKDQIQETFTADEGDKFVFFTWETPLPYSDL